MTSLGLLPKFLAPLLLLPLAMLSACTPQVREYGGGGAGGAGGGSSSSGGMQCTSNADCGANGECQSFACTNGACAVNFAPMGTVVELQQIGDCLSKVCDGKGYVIDVPDPVDSPNDGNPCTDDTCVDGKTQFTPVAAGVSCEGTRYCDTAGQCVNCLQDSQCPNGICSQSTCTTANCGNMAIDMGETDIDCGGPLCPPCGPNRTCSVDKDCTSQVCTSGACAAPTCMDNVFNGLETYIDCGGADCMPCKPGVACKIGSDCMSHICAGGVCAEAACDDKVTNGGESDIDCGGPMCPNCTLGRMCNSASDCTSNDCCFSNPPSPGYCKMPGTPCELVLRNEITQ